MMREDSNPFLDLHADIPPEVERVAHAIIGCAIEVHRELGPGLLERLYEDTLVYELTQRGLSIERQVEVRVPYKAIELVGQRLDVIVERRVVIELKSIEAVKDIHKAQLLSYLRASGLPLGLLLNFNVTLMKNGITRILNDRAVSPSSPSRSSRSMD